MDGNQDAFVAKINPAGTALIYSTYLGGSGYDQAYGLAVDSTGAAWMTGLAGSTDFPVLNAAQAAFGGGSDAFVARLNASGGLQFSTFLGGSAGESGNAIAVDSANNGYVTGYTYSGTFPTTSGALSYERRGTFVAKYGPGGAVLYATLLGGQHDGLGIAVDSSFNAYVTGITDDGAFTGMPAGGAQTTNNGNGDAFVAKLNPDGTSLVYFTFLGGTGFDQGTAIAVDALGNAYIAGQTNSMGLATKPEPRNDPGGRNDGFAAELNPSGSAFSYITYLGGNPRGLSDGAGAGRVGKRLPDGLHRFDQLPDGLARPADAARESAYRCSAAPIPAAPVRPSTRTFPARSSVSRSTPPEPLRGCLDGSRGSTGR